MRNPPSRTLQIGAALVVLAGVGLLVGTFLPWTTASFEQLDGRQDTAHSRGVGSFSGWDLIVDCAHREAPSVCVIEDPSTVISSEWIPTRVTSGEWSLVIGVATAGVGVALSVCARRRGSCPRGLVGVGWLVSVAGFAGTLAMFATMFDQPNGTSVMHTEGGVVLIAASATLGIVAMTVVQVGVQIRAQIGDSCEAELAPGAVSSSVG